MNENEGLPEAEGMVWDLDALYRGEDDPRIDADLRKARLEARAFAARYRGDVKRIAWDPRLFLDAVRAYEKIHERAMGPYFFAVLLQAGDTQDHGKNALLQRVREEWSDISKTILFFEVEIRGLSEEFLKGLSEEPVLSPYRHFLKRAAAWKPHTLTEPEERVLRERQVCGREALGSFFDEFIGSLSFPVELGGEVTPLTLERALTLLHSRDGSLRERAFDALLAGLGKQALVFKYVLNSLMLDRHLEDRQRGHPGGMHRAHLEKEADAAAIEHMMEVVEAHYPLAGRYFKLKAKSLGLEKLKNSDLFAPVGDREIAIPFSEAKDLILGVLKEVHPLFHEKAWAFFENRRIDAEARRGKRAGAFCECFSPTQPPFILMSYTGTLRSVLVLAHELGHGIHAGLASEQSHLNFTPSLLLAETASTLCENLLIGALLEAESFRPLRAPLLATRIEGVITTVFRQAVLTRFEQTLHGRREKHLLGADEICDVWWAENGKLYGRDVEMLPSYRWGWTYIPHFIHSPFYCYSYVFGCLVSIHFLEGYRSREGEFPQLLRAGGSGTPQELLSRMGWDPTRKTFWEQALRSVEEWIDAFEKTLC